MAVSEEFTLSADGRTLTGQFATREGTRVATLRWATPELAAQNRAIAEAAMRETVIRQPPGDKRRTRRWQVGPYAIYVHVNTGPPTWWKPRLIREPGTLGVGWLRLLTVVHVKRT